MTKNIGDISRYRRTEHINRKTTQSIYRAFDFARAKGLPLNTYAVINIRDNHLVGADIFEAIRHKFRDWSNYKLKKITPSAFTADVCLYIRKTE